MGQGFYLLNIKSADCGHTSCGRPPQANWQPANSPRRRHVPKMTADCRQIAVRGSGPYCAISEMVESAMVSCCFVTVAQFTRASRTGSIRATFVLICRENPLTLRDRTAPARLPRATFDIESYHNARGHYDEFRSNLDRHADQVRFTCRYQRFIRSARDPNS